MSDHIQTILTCQVCGTEHCICPDDMAKCRERMHCVQRKSMPGRIIDDVDYSHEDAEPLWS